MIKKNWNLNEMKRRIKNLKKILNPIEVDMYVTLSKCKTNNELDSLYMAYYALKRMHLKYNTNLFGHLNHVEYEPILKSFSETSPNQWIEYTPQTYYYNGTVFDENTSIYTTSCTTTFYNNWRY